MKPSISLSLTHIHLYFKASDSSALQLHSPFFTTLCFRPCSVIRLKFLLFLQKKENWTDQHSECLCVSVCMCVYRSFRLVYFKASDWFAENHIMPCRLFRHTHVCTLKRQTLVHGSCIHPSLPYSAAVHAVCSVSSFCLFAKESLTDQHSELSCVYVSVSFTLAGGRES